MSYRHCMCCTVSTLYAYPLGLHTLYYILHRDVDNIQHHVHCIVWV